jgi:hypothetical protein
MDEEAREALSESVLETLAKVSANWQKQLGSLGEQVNSSALAQASVVKQAGDFARSYEAAFQSIAESIRPYRAAIESLADAMKPLQDVARLISRIDLTWVRDAWLAAMPPNWQELSPYDIDRVLAVMEETGWCLAWCPRRDTILALIEAGDVETRTKLFLDAKATIIVDLDECLAAVEHQESQQYRHAASRAVRAFEDGHLEAAQALAAADISAIINHGYRLNFADARRKWRGHPKDEPIDAFREQAVLNMVAHSLQQYYGATDPVPTSFSRHATAHSISPEQYTEVNSLAALLLVVALTAEANLLMEWASEQEQPDAGS